MQNDVIMAGFGGQGVLLIGKMLAYAGMARGQGGLLAALLRPGDARRHRQLHGGHLRPAGRLAGRRAPARASLVLNLPVARQVRAARSSRAGCSSINTLADRPRRRSAPTSRVVKVPGQRDRQRARQPARRQHGRARRLRRRDPRGVARGGRGRWCARRSPASRRSSRSNLEALAARLRARRAGVAAASRRRASERARAVRRPDAPLDDDPRALPGGRAVADPGAAGRPPGLQLPAVRRARAGRRGARRAARQGLLGRPPSTRRSRSTPQGRTIVRVCTGTACHIRGAGAAPRASSSAQLGIKPGETTDGPGVHPQDRQLRRRLRAWRRCVIVGEKYHGDAPSRPRSASYLGEGRRAHEN